MADTKADYTIGLVRKLLVNYGCLEEGQNPLALFSGNAVGAQMEHSNVAPHEWAAILKADIDRAIQQLSHRKKLIVLVVDVDCRNIYDCAFWLDSDIRNILREEREALLQMVGYLEGRIIAKRRKRK